MAVFCGAWLGWSCSVSASPSGLPMPSPPVPLISLPLPAAASARAKSWTGFRDALRFPDGTVVVSTGGLPGRGNPAGGRRTRSPALSQDSVAGHFQQVLGGVGFWSEPVPAAAGGTALRFSRGADR